MNIAILIISFVAVAAVCLDIGYRAGNGAFLMPVKQHDKYCDKTEKPKTDEKTAKEINQYNKEMENMLSYNGDEQPDLK